MACLTNIVRLYEIEEARAQDNALLRKVGGHHGEGQAECVRLNSRFDFNLIISRIMLKSFQIPLDKPWKTVACLTRGVSLPYTFAVSGWTPGAYGTTDGTLDRTRWVKEVFKLANIIQHDLGQDPRDAEGAPGSFLACHSEKQVLAYLVFHHTSAYLVNDDDEATLNRLQNTNFKGGRKIMVNCDPPTLKKLKANVFVCQPGQNQSWICGDCIEFCRKVTIKFGLRLGLRTVTRENGVFGNDLVESWA